MMMKAFFQVVLSACLLLGIPFSAMAQWSDGYQYDENGCCSSDWCNGWDVEVRSAYFLPSNNLERELYKGARFDAEVQVNKSFCNGWELWGNFTYFQKTGHSALNNKTTLTLYPLSLGVRYVFPITFCMNAYLGAGINGTWIHLHNVDPFLQPERFSRFKVGVTGKSGLIYNITECIYLDAFIDYLYIPANFVNADNVGGFNFGLGLGYRF